MRDGVSGWRVGASKCGWPFANCVVGSEMILLDRESEEAAAEDALGRTWS